MTRQYYLHIGELQDGRKIYCIMPQRVYNIEKDCKYLVTPNQAEQKEINALDLEHLIKEALEKVQMIKR